MRRTLRLLDASAPLLALALLGCGAPSSSSESPESPGSSGSSGGGGPMAAQSVVMVKLSACTGDSLEADKMLESIVLPATKLPTATVTCVTAAADCTETLACLGMDPNIACTGSGSGRGGTCTGNTLVGCGEFNNGLKLEKMTDCTQDTSGNLECLGGRCGLTTTCTTTGEFCDADVVVGCWNDVAYRQDCALTGRTCEVMPSGQPVCVVAGATCTNQFCDGDVHVNCEQGFQYIRTDCPVLDADLECVEKPRPQAPHNAQCAVPAGTEECTDGDAECSGAVARHCAGGKWYDFDCAAFLSGTCELTSGEHVRCRVPGLP